VGDVGPSKGDVQGMLDHEGGGSWDHELELNNQEPKIAGLLMVTVLAGRVVVEYWILVLRMAVTTIDGWIAGCIYRVL
jgi:hypothetical protein